jgi:hypothetical protein
MGRNNLKTIRKGVAKMEIQAIEGHLYKSWAVYQSNAYQVCRIEIYRWGQGSTMAPQRARGFQITDLQTAGVTIWESDDADKLIHVFSYFETAGFEQDLFDTFISSALSAGGFLAVDVNSLLNEHAPRENETNASIQ